MRPAHSDQAGPSSDIIHLLIESVARWNRLGEALEVHFQSLINENAVYITVDPVSSMKIVDYLAEDIFAESIPGSRVEVSVTSPATASDWVVIQLRDFSGGRNDDWRLPPEIFAEARQLGGYLDIQIESGRMTQFSLTLPTNCLSQWFRARNLSDHLIFVGPIDSVERIAHRDSGTLWQASHQRVMERLRGFGAIQRLQLGYLLAASNAGPSLADRVTKLEHSLRELNQNIGAQDQFQVSYLGSIDSFLDRAEKTLRDQNGKSTEATLKRQAMASSTEKTRWDQSTSTPKPYRLRPRKRQGRSAFSDRELKAIAFR